ncbi:MAG TPA: GFA family protein [Marinobacter sp.]|nr:GFA family protein [Marinobacter sp.]
MMYSGRCLCGDIQFQYDGPLGPVVLCHCKQCQRAHGSAFSASAPAQAIHMRWLTGADQVKEYASSPGKYRGFCGRCGSQLYSRVDAISAILRLRVGALEQPLGKAAAQHVYVAAQSDWFQITDSLPQFDKTERTNDPH